MARFRKVDPRIWNDEKFLSLSDDGQLLFLFLLTHPHMTSLGAMRATISGLAEEKRWPRQRLSKAFQEAFRKGLVEYEKEACYVGLPNFLKYNGPENPNVVKSWESALDLIPECDSKVLLVERVKAFVKGLPESWQKLPEGFGKGSARARASEQEQEQEPEQEQEQDKNGASPKFKPPTVEEVREYCTERHNGIDPQAFLDFYNQSGWKRGKGLPVTDWKACVRTWENNQPLFGSKKSSSGPGQTFQGDAGERVKF